MCGISGFIVKERQLSEAELYARLRATNHVLRHRGPDHEGAWTDGQVGLGNTRLSIIDLSPAGHQPMASADGQIRVSFNGEIYNFPELREELIAAGYTFRSRSDTEVIVYGYDAWDCDVFSRLRGMFAVAIWDNRRRRLVLARDRIGEKPLYYTFTRDAFLFASEIKGILTWPTVERNPDFTAIDYYLTYQYVPAPWTAFAGIRKLPTAHYMLVEPAADGSFGEPRLVRYWRLPNPNQSRRQPSLADLKAELVHRLEEAVKLRLISDVPLGAFLSGGVDSSAVVAMMARVGGDKIKTFSCGFNAPEYDETRYARMVAERYGTDHEVVVVESDAIAVLPKLVWHYGEPFADPSAIPTYYLSELARRKVTVVLNGDGGDESFFGYPRYAAVRHLTKLNGVPIRVLRLAAHALGLVPQGLDRRGRLARVRELLHDVQQSRSQRYGFTITYFSNRDKRAGYGDALKDYLNGSALDLLEPYFAEAPTMVSGANWADIHTYLPDDLMVKVDVATMANGLEARSPFLDHVLMEWAASIPESIRMAGGESKVPLKRAMEPYLPREVIYRPKMGFGCPIDHWFRADLKELAYDTLLSESFRTRGLFRPEYVGNMLDQHCSGAAMHHTRLWALLMLELWFRMWIDAPAAALAEKPAA